MRIRGAYNRNREHGFGRLPPPIAVTMGISRAAPAESRSFNTDPVLLWNDQANQAIQLTATDPFKASRALAIESIAVFDTIRSVNREPGFLVRLTCIGRDEGEHCRSPPAAHAACSSCSPRGALASDATYAWSMAQAAR